MSISNFIKRLINSFLSRIYGFNSSIATLFRSNGNDNLFYNKDIFDNSIKGESVILYPVYKIYNSSIKDYTYISQNAHILNTSIGKFCSIGPNLVCGWGVHPTNGLSTAPMFYSTRKQNGTTLSSKDKLIELQPITIGNDVFIGMNVSILDGVSIGDGAIIAAGTVVYKDVPPYAIVGGNPMKVIRYRFEDTVIKELLNIKWWNWSSEQLKNVEEMFFDINTFIEKYKINKSN